MIALALERGVANLVHNAMAHGGRHVMIRVIASGFEVEDDGTGIPADKCEAVFEPFHRLRPRTNGRGLGLNLVQQVEERNGGRVTIHAAASGGATVRFELPSADVAA